MTSQNFFNEKKKTEVKDILKSTNHFLRKERVPYFLLGQKVDTLHAPKTDKFRCTVSKVGHRSPQNVEISGGH